MKLSDEQLSVHDEMEKKLPELSEKYFKNPEITSIGVSLKVVNNKLKSELSFTFGVKKKLPSAQVKEPIPASIFGYPTDVIEFEVTKSRNPVTAIDASRNEKTDPLIGGISISADDELEHGGVKTASRGTLGVMVNKNDDDNPYIITCAHVLAGSGTELDSDVCQQSKWETEFEYCHNCASLKAYYHENVSYERNGVIISSWLDCAIARKGWFRNAVIGKVYGVENVIGGFAVINPSIIGKKVSKSGIKTGITSGVITSINTSGRLEQFDGQEVIATNLIIVRGEGGKFSDSGDSGSAVFNTQDSLLIGILDGANTLGDESFISPSDAILSKWSNLSFKSK